VREHRTEIKKHDVVGLKKMALPDGVELSPFSAFDFSLGMLTGRKTSRHYQCFEGLKFEKTFTPLLCGAPGVEFKNKMASLAFKEKMAHRDVIVGLKIGF